MNIHVVKKGETLGLLCRKYAVEGKALRLANSLKVPGPLCPGQSLFIPGDLPYGRRSLEVSIFLSSPPDTLSADAFTYFSFYSHRFDEEGRLIEPDFDCGAERLRDAGCAPLLCLANLNEYGGFSPELAHTLFSSAQVQDRLTGLLLSRLRAGKYYGLQLCFNYLFPFDKDNYSAYVSMLAELLHHEGFILSVELAPPDSPALSSAFDYAALGSFADRLSLMFCRWGHACSPPQPLAPFNYIRDALNTLRPLIPGEKMLLGLSGCGFDWKLPWHQGDRAQQITNPLAAELAMSLNAEIQYDSRAQSPCFDYTDAALRRHRVYFEDARSISAKLELVEEFSLAGLCLYSFERALRPGNAIPERLYNAEKLL